MMVSDQLPYIEHNGKRYIRASTIASQVTDYSGIDPAVLANKARIGTDAHTAIAEDIAGIPPTPPDDAIKYYLSWRHWYDLLRPDYLVTEERYYSEALGYTGQVDAVIKLPDSGDCVLLDYKTSVNESPSWPIQAALYYLLLTENGLDVAPKALFLKLNKEAKQPKVFTYHITEGLRLSALNALSAYKAQLNISI